MHSGLSGLSHSSPTSKSVLHFLIFLEIRSGGSKRLMRELSFSELFDILLLPKGNTGEDKAEIRNETTKGVIQR